MSGDGVLCLDKPAGMTSFAAVAAVRRLLGARKAGHTGTLDPMATGVLPVCFGEATKLTQFLVEHDKRYRATVVLGTETDTEDATGTVTATADWTGVTAESVVAAAGSFVGSYRQTVPAYSAVRVGGRRLYEQARRGEPVERPEREVRIHSLVVERFDPPELDLDVTCGRGTYVRTLAADLGRRLGCGAHLGALRRLRVGVFGIEDAVTLDALRGGEPPRLIGLRAALGEMPEVRLDAGPAERLARGGRLDDDVARRLPAGLAAATDPDGNLVAVLRYRENRCEIVRVFRAPACIPSRVADEDTRSDDGRPALG